MRFRSMDTVIAQKVFSGRDNDIIIQRQQNIHNQ